MNITRKWLSNFIEIENIKDEEITVALNSLGFEVDSYKNYALLNDKLTIGHVGGVTPIEDTHLNFCFIDKGEELVSPVVCGANNVKEGQFVILAEPGKTIANGMTLDIREIKGRQSEGMFCALTEIGMDESVLTDKEKDSIYEVFTKTDTYTHIGHQDALDIIGFSDSVWEVDLTLNRSDALGALQIAKELSNYFDLEFTNISKILEPKFLDREIKQTIKIAKDIDDVLKTSSMQLFSVKELITLADHELNIFSNQDLWLKYSGVKTSNNFFLDLANAIAIETGQPVMFLDPTKVGKELELINNPNKENSINLQLTTDDKVISTIGIDFNEDFLPDVKSTEILVLCLSLDPIFMRKQQKSFNLSTPSIQRYMKPISTELYKVAYQRVIYWLDQYSLLGSATEVKVFKETLNPINNINIELEYIQELLGFEITFEQISSLFKTLDFSIEKKDNVLIFGIDPIRTDITQRADIVEEIARLFGYNNIEPVPPLIISREKHKNIELKIRNQIESFLIGQRFNNIKTYSIVNSEEAIKWDMFKIGNPINLMSPLSKLRETYRLSVSNSLVEVASFNASKGNKVLKLYEFADIYNKDNVRERHLGMLISGDVLNDNARKIKVKSDYSYIKGLVESIFGHYQFEKDKVSFEKETLELDEIHPFINAKITYKNELIGFIFKLNPRTEQSLKLEPTFLVELNYTMIEEMFNDKVLSSDISKFQKTSRDISIVLNNDLNYEQTIIDLKSGVNLITNTNVFDIYSDEELEKNNSKSLSISFEFNSVSHQLTDEEVSIEFNKILDKVKKLKIEVR